MDVQHIAKLAHLQLDEKQLKNLEKDMQAIVKMVEQLPAADETEDLREEKDFMLLREDEIAPSYPREEILKNAPQTAEGCFKVPGATE